MQGRRAAPRSLSRCRSCEQLGGGRSVRVAEEVAKLAAEAPLLPRSSGHLVCELHVHTELEGQQQLIAERRALKGPRPRLCGEVEQHVVAAAQLVRSRP